MEWYLLEKKELHLSKSLEIKNKSSSNSSIAEWENNKQLFWVKAKSIKEDVFENVLANSKLMMDSDEFRFEDFAQSDDKFQNK